MPTHRSAVKRVKTSEARRLRNAAVKSRVKTAIKKVEAAVADKNTEEIPVLLKEAVSLLDKAVSKKVMHKNAAARQKSSLVRKVQAYTAPSEE